MLRLPLGAPLPIACPDFTPAKPTIHVATLSGEIFVHQAAETGKHKKNYFLYSAWTVESTLILTYILPVCRGGLLPREHVLWV